MYLYINICMLGLVWFLCVSTWLKYVSFLLSPISHLFIFKILKTTRFHFAASTNFREPLFCSTILPSSRNRRVFKCLDGDIQGCFLGVYMRCRVESLIILCNLGPSKKISRTRNDTNLCRNHI